MSNKRTILLIIFIYGIVTLVLFCRNISFSEEPIIENINSEEGIVDEDRRAMLRAFYTAPPVIPHELESQDFKDCLLCHLEVTKFEDGRTAPETPHPQLSNCLQCHVPSQPGGNQKVGSTWRGLEEPKRGDRWFTVSPPTIPHRIFLRENCLSCHDPENPDTRLRTPHPQRTSCLQCHVPNRSIEF